MAKKVVTISISIPAELAEELDRLSTEVNVSRSSFTTALIAMAIKWIYKAKEII